MCLVMTDGIKPNTTKLITVELEPLKAGAPSPSGCLLPPRTYLSIYSNKIDSGPSSYNHKAQMMIVPVPNEDCLPVEMVEYDQDQSGDVIFNLCKSLVPRTSHKTAPRRSRSMHDTYCLASNSTVEIQQVGGYKVSVAMTMDDLINRVDWSKFAIPMNFDSLMADMRRRFGKNNSFIVAEPTRSSTHDMGGDFAWVYQSRKPCLPTAHEKSASELVKYDVVGFTFGTRPLKLRWGNGLTMNMDVSTKDENLDPGLCRRLVKALEKGRLTKSGRGRIRVMGPLTSGARLDINCAIPTNDHVYISTKPTKHVTFKPKQMTTMAHRPFKWSLVLLLVLITVAVAIVAMRYASRQAIEAKP